ncbi:MAG: hypothetical protein WCC17_00230 [Candidatus Nitrosopolaris sp.]
MRWKRNLYPSLKWTEREKWQSSKFDFDAMDSDEIKELQIPELGVSFGAAVSTLKQSWAESSKQRRVIENAVLCEHN